MKGWLLLLLSLLLLPLFQNVEPFHYSGLSVSVPASCSGSWTGDAEEARVRVGVLQSAVAVLLLTVAVAVAMTDSLVLKEAAPIPSLESRLPRSIRPEWGTG